MHYSALIAQRRVESGVTTPVWDTLCPAYRIPTVLDVRTTQEIPGGWLEGEFTIPTSRVRFDAELLEPFSTVWLFNGLSPCFYGHVVKATPQRNGEIIVALDGAYRRLEDTRMRSVWQDSDLTTLTTSPGSANSASSTVNASGNLVLSLPKDHTYAAGDYIAVDYYLFGEALGTRDTKKVDGWSVNLGSASTFVGDARLEVRVYGMSGPSDATPVLLQLIQNAVTWTEISDTSHGADNNVAWPIAGYRCIRVGLYATSAITAIATDRTAIITNLTVTTRGRALGLNTTPSTTDIVKDVWTQAANTYDTSNLVQEEYAGTTGGMVTGNIADSGQRADGITFSDWVSPGEIVDAMAGVDGYKVGMWEPTKNIPSSGHVTKASTTINYWYRQPAELTYTAWNDLSDPDYIIRLQLGAVWEPDGQPNPLASAVYVNYTSRRGRPQSVFTEDATVENRLWEQGWHVAPDWTIDPSVNSQTASTLAARYLALNRQPVLSGTLTLYGDRPGSIEYPGGAQLSKLSTVRPGVFRIADAKGGKSARGERLEYTARTASAPEMLVITLNNPASAKLDRRLARIAARDARRRNR